MTLPDVGNRNKTMKTIQDNDQDEKLKRAKKRVDEIKGFYIHLTVYVVINTFILINIGVSNLGEGDSFWDFSGFVTPLFWGIGLAFHAMYAFQKNPLFSKKWEEKMIQKYIEKDKQEADKYK